MVPRQLYLSWNSGVSCRNSRPGWESRMPAIMDLRSSGATWRQPSFLRMSNMRRTGSTCTASWVTLGPDLLFLCFFLFFSFIIVVVFGATRLRCLCLVSCCGLMCWLGCRLTSLCSIIVRPPVMRKAQYSHIHSHTQTETGMREQPHTRTL